MDNRDNEWRSMYLKCGMSPVEIEKDVKSLSVDAEIQENIVEVVARSKTGAVIFWSDQRKYLVIPPFPVRETINNDTLHVKPLLALLQTDWRIALVLVRLGSYGIGVCHGEKLITSKVGTGLIHGRHKKGGSSAHRFERHRDKQIEYFLTRVCQRAREQLEPHLNSLDYLIYGGARTTIQLLQKQCPFVSKLETETLQPLFDIPEPRQSVLEKAVSRVWSSTVIEWIED
jgi:peptide subunit release factor 1 (eRF1)